MFKSFFGGVLFLVASACAGQAAAQAWTQLAPSGGPPAGRVQSSAVLNTVNDTMTVFGGYEGGPTSNEVWVLANADSKGAAPKSWTLHVPTGTPTPTRFAHSAVYDETNNRMIVFAGIVGGAYNNDVLVLSNADGKGSGPSAWTRLTTNAPPLGRYEHSAVYDPVSNRMTVFGGHISTGGYANDVWVLSNANGMGATSPAWTQLAPTGPAPAQRNYHSAIYIAATNRMVVYDGANATALTDDVWVLTNANGLDATPPAWKQLLPTGTPPPARYTHTAVYDPATNHMIVFGGCLTVNCSQANDTWVLSNADGTEIGAPAWTHLSPTGALPGPRDFNVAVFNVANNTMVVFGGYSGSGYFNDTWVLADASGVIDLAVGIDIRPNTDVNNISLKTGGDLPVAILSSANFDAPSMVDRDSLTFGHAGIEASLIGCNAKSQDVNGDKKQDLVCHFDIGKTGLQLGDAVGNLKGLTLVGNRINGGDLVKINK